MCGRGNKGEERWFRDRGKGEKKRGNKKRVCKRMLKKNGNDEGKYVREIWRIKEIARGYEENGSINEE